MLFIMKIERVNIENFHKTHQKLKFIFSIEETMNGDIVECPPEGKLFCRNGGKCHFIESLREPSCQ
jgi:hypothetical protein